MAVEIDCAADGLSAQASCRFDADQAAVPEARTKNLLKGALKREGVTYAQFAERLSAMELIKNQRNLWNKISRRLHRRRYDPMFNGYRRFHRLGLTISQNQGRRPF